MRRFLALSLLTAGALVACEAVPSAPGHGPSTGLSGSAWAAINYNASKSNTGNVAKGKGGKGGGKSTKHRR